MYNFLPFLLTRENLDAYQKPKGKFGNKQPGQPCGDSYISFRYKCSDKNVAKARKRLKGSSEGAAYANRVRRFKDLAKLQPKDTQSKGNQPKSAQSKGTQPKGNQSKPLDLARMTDDEKMDYLRNNPLKRATTQEQADMFEAVTKSLPKEKQIQLIEERAKASAKSTRSRAGKKAAKTRKFRQAAKDERLSRLNSTAEGKALISAEDALSKTVQGNTILDQRNFDKAHEAVQIARDNVKVRNALDNPTDAQRKHDEQAAPLNLNEGPAPKESWRVHGSNKWSRTTGLNNSASEATGIPWQVEMIDGKKITVAGAYIKDKSFDRAVILKGTDGSSVAVPLPSGDAAISRRARRLIHHIGQGKSRTDLSTTDLAAMIKGDDVYAKSTADRQEIKRQAKENARKYMA